MTDLRAENSIVGWVEPDIEPGGGVVWVSFSLFGVQIIDETQQAEQRLSALAHSTQRDLSNLGNSQCFNRLQGINSR